MSQLVLILPGATDFELQGRIHGDLDLPLCAEGQAEVERVGRELQDLGIEVLYTSTCEWARQSADSLGKLLQVKVKKLDNLQNLDHGLWQGMLIEEVRQKQPTVYRQWQEQPETLCPPEGETIDHARTRVAAVLTKVLKKHKDGVIGLVVPEPLASVIRDFLGQEELGDLWRANCEHGRWSVIELVAGTAVRPTETTKNGAHGSKLTTGGLNAKVSAPAVTADIAAATHAGR